MKVFIKEEIYVDISKTLSFCRSDDAILFYQSEKHVVCATFDNERCAKRAFYKICEFIKNNKSDCLVLGSNGLIIP